MRFSRARKGSPRSGLKATGGCSGARGLRARELGGCGARELGSGGVRVPRSDRVKATGQSPLGRILDLDLLKDFFDGDADMSE